MEAKDAAERQMAVLKRTMEQRRSDPVPSVQTTPLASPASMRLKPKQIPKASNYLSDDDTGTALHRAPSMGGAWQQQYDRFMSAVDGPSGPSGRSEDGPTGSRRFQDQLPTSTDDARMDMEAEALRERKRTTLTQLQHEARAMAATTNLTRRGRALGLELPASSRSPSAAPPASAPLCAPAAAAEKLVCPIASPHTAPPPPRPRGQTTGPPTPDLRQRWSYTQSPFLTWPQPEWSGYAALQITLEQLLQTQRLFVDMDVDGTGFLTLQKMGNWIVQHRLWDVTYVELQAMLRQVDVDRTGRVGWWVFLAVRTHWLLQLRRRGVPLSSWLAFCLQSGLATPSPAPSPAPSTGVARQPSAKPWHRPPARGTPLSLK
eukprot:TRINITY_DN16433_c0_g1_i1.p1 TRINITY_DN16433_c0_g1~~TRINITY_DN16433_c0_g1_i1.p1  ORF type:complete len:374 (+),score=65.64 TRINITY_DN16433_c0_g1_i1:710-1831(+)